MKNGKNNVGIKQIAHRLGVSQGTVSVVLNGRGDELRISKATQQRVLDTAREMGYRPNVNSHRMRGSRGDGAFPVISLLSPDSEVSAPTGRMISGMQHAILESGIGVELFLRPFRHNFLEKEEKYLSDSACNGAIVCAPSQIDLNYLISRDFNIPLVLFNQITGKYGTVYVDDYEAGRRVAELFAARGHKNVGMLLPFDHTKPTSLRLIGFQDGCRDNGLTLERKNVCEAALSTQGGRDAAANLLDGGSMPTAVFALINDMAVGMLQECVHRGVDIPGQIELMSYGDNPIEAATTPSLSSIRLPMEEMSEMSLKMIINMIHSGDWSPVSRVREQPFIFRESCGGFPKK